MNALHHITFFTILSPFIYYGPDYCLYLGIIALAFYLFLLFACSITTFYRNKNNKQSKTDYTIFYGLNCLYKRYLITKTIEEAIEENRKLPPKVIVVGTASHKESRERWDEKAIVETIGTRRYDYFYGGNVYEIKQDCKINSEYKTIRSYYSEWERIDKGGGKMKGNPIRPGHGCAKNVETREKESWKKELDYKYLTWQDNTNFIMNCKDPFLEVHFELEINLDDEAINAINNMKDELEKEGKTKDPITNSSYNSLCPEFQEVVICLKKNDQLKNLLFFILGIIMLLLGYSDIIDFFFSYELKVVKIKTIKVVSNINKYRAHYMEKDENSFQANLLDKNGENIFDSIELKNPLI